MVRCPYCGKQFNYPEEYMHAKWCRKEVEKAKKEYNNVKRLNEVVENAKTTSK